MKISTYRVDELKCEHCVAAVTQELSTPVGVARSTVDLGPGVILTVARPVGVGPNEVAQTVASAGDCLVADGCDFEVVESTKSAPSA
jgi:copper chaperone